MAFTLKRINSFTAHVENEKQFKNISLWFAFRVCPKTLRNLYASVVSHKTSTTRRNKKACV